MTTLRLFLFGGFRVEVDGYPVPAEAWSRYRLARKLLSRLALAPQHRLHRDALIETLWAERSPADPDNRLSQEATNIQRALDGAKKTGLR
jgi:DNA-binding SARP family transcriptional activator